MKKTLGAPFVVLLWVCSAFAQQPSATSTPNPDESRRRHTSRHYHLVQVDAVVLDKHGKQVTNLQPEDFIISEDGRPQDITNFSYISTGAAPPAYARKAKRTTDKTLPPGAPTNVGPEDARRRILALVVDDLSLSFESMYYARQPEKLCDEDEPTELVAILRTRCSGLWAQFFARQTTTHAASSGCNLRPRTPRIPLECG